MMRDPGADSERGAKSTSSVRYGPVADMIVGVSVVRVVPSPLRVAHSRYRTTRKNRGHIPPREPRLTSDTSDRKANGEIRFLTCWRSTCGEADAGMPGCRDAGPQYKVNTAMSGS
jgi:hypothetical protein